jgi:uncharacterized protein
VHISQLSDQFVKNPADVVKVGQRVQVTIMEVDMARKRIALSMKTKPELAPRGDRKSEPAGAGGKRFNDRPAAGSGQRQPAGGSGGGFDWFAAAQKKKH